MKHLTAVLALAAIAVCNHAIAKPLKVYVLAGQSNMQGHYHSRQLKTLADDPSTKDLHTKLVDADGKPRVFDKVDISYFSTIPFRNPKTDLRKHGKLTVGYGGNGYRSQDIECGPELPFGALMQEHMGERILLIKAAWGGTDMFKRWRSPSAGPIQISENRLKIWRDRGRNIEEETAKLRAGTGDLYEAMVAHVREVLADPAKYCPGHKAEDGYEFAGFVWFQGWNDMADETTYFGPRAGNPGAYGLYTKLLAHFIRDVRKEFKAPNMPFIIGELGVYGDTTKDAKMLGFRKAQTAVADIPEFKGNVMFVPTAKYWDSRLADICGRKENALRRKIIPDQFIQNKESILALVGEHWKLHNDRDKGSREEKRERSLRQREVQQELDNLLKTEDERKYEQENSSNGGYHYLGSARIYCKIGRAFAEALIEMHTKPPLR